jgi:hypothetical protein
MGIRSSVHPMARHIDIRKKSVQSGDALCPIALVPQANRRSTYPQPAATARLETPSADICTILPYPREASQLEVSPDFHFLSELAI